MLTCPPEIDDPDFDDRSFAYIWSKASTYLDIGPAAYRSRDFFGHPGESLAATDIDAITRGCRQLLHGHGCSPANPFRELEHDDIVRLASLFDFDVDVSETVTSPDQALLIRYDWRHQVYPDKFQCVWLECPQDHSA